MKTTKDEISRVTVDLIRARGYSGVRVADVCTALNVTKGSFYHHFACIDDVIIYWFSRSFADKLAGIPETDSGDALADLKKYYMTYAETVSGLGHDLLYGITGAMARRKKPLSAVQLKIELEGPAAVDLIRRAQAEGQITDKIPAETLQRQYIYAYSGLVFDWYAKDGGIDFLKEIEALLDTIFR